MDFQEETDIYRSFVRYQTRLLHVFDDLAQEHDMNVIDADGNVRDVFVSLREGITDSVQSMKGRDDSYRVIDDEKVITRLGRGLAASGRISTRAIEESADAIANLKKIAEGCHASVIRAVATSATREAENSVEFIDLVRERAEIDLEVISEEDEARLAFTCVSRAFDLGFHTSAIIDVGGGSTEIILSSGHVIERLTSMPLGGVRLTEQFNLGGEFIHDDDYRALRKHIRRTLKEAIGKVPFAPHLVFGTGGTLTTLAAISLTRGAPPGGISCASLVCARSGSTAIGTPSCHRSITQDASARACPGGRPEP